MSRDKPRSVNWLTPSRIHRYAADDSGRQLSSSNFPSPQLQKHHSGASVSVKTNPSASNPYETHQSCFSGLPPPSLPAQLARIPPQAQAPDYAYTGDAQRQQHSPTEYHDPSRRTRDQRSGSTTSAPLQKVTSGEHQARLDDSGPKLMPGMVSNAERMRRRQSSSISKRQSFAESTREEERRANGGAGLAEEPA